jgi:hypothetical protein
MSDVLVASPIEEGARVAPLVDGLRAAGFSIWWDGDLAGGEHRQQKITSELAAARCVVVVWTTASVGPAGELVQDVASRAKERGILLPVRLDRVTEPLGFGQIRSLDLTRWNGRPRNRRFKEVVAAARAIVAGNLRPRPATEHRLLRRLAGITVSLAILLPLLSFFSDVHEILAPACQVVGVRAVCARWGIGGVPTPAEEMAWAARKEGDCSALRAYLVRFPGGGHAEEAQRKLLAAQTKVTERWEAQEHSPVLRVLAEHKPFSSQAEAQADALVRAAADAELVCAPYKSLEYYRLRAATAKVVKWACEPSRGGFICGFDGQAICKVEARKREHREVCR